MPLKPFIYEFCKRCGAKDAEVRGEFIWSGLHNCTEPAPGPERYPKRFQFNKVVFIQDPSIEQPRSDDDSNDALS